MDNNLEKLLGSGGDEKRRAIRDCLLDIYNEHAAVDWLTTPSPALGSRRPLDVLEEEGGPDRVLEAISRLTWGIKE